MKKLGFFLIIALIVVCNSCSSGEDEDVVTTCTFHLKNASNADVHMWITGEDIMPNNKLAPGESRSVTYTKSKEVLEDTNANVHDEVVVWAGRNGVALNGKTFLVGGIDGEKWAFFKDGYVE